MNLKSLALLPALLLTTAAVQGQTNYHITQTEEGKILHMPELQQQIKLAPTWQVDGGTDEQNGNMILIYPNKNPKSILTIQWFTNPYVRSTPIKVQQTILLAALEKQLEDDPNSVTLKPPTLTHPTLAAASCAYKKPSKSFPGDVICTGMVYQKANQIIFINGIYLETEKDVYAPPLKKMIQQIKIQ